MDPLYSIVNIARRFEKRNNYERVKTSLVRHHMLPRFQISNCRSTDTQFVYSRFYRPMNVDSRDPSGSSFLPDIYHTARAFHLDLNSTVSPITMIIPPTPGRVSIKNAAFLTSTEPDTGMYIEKAYEGAMMYVMYDGDEWTWYTSSRRGAWRTRFGKCFEDYLQSKHKMTREDFESMLDKTNVYGFNVVDHRLKRYMDHSPELGEDYSCVFLSSIYRKYTMETVDEDPTSLTDITPRVPRLTNNREALEYLQTGDAYGVLVRPTSSILEGGAMLVQSESLLTRISLRAEDPYTWRTMLEVYIDHATTNGVSLEEYIAYHGIMDPECAKESNELAMDPIGSIEALFRFLAKFLERMLCQYTDYNAETGRYHGDNDGDMSPMVRFHVCQLRNMFMPNRGFPDLDIIENDYLKKVCDRIEIEELAQHIRDTVPLDTSDLAVLDSVCRAKASPSPDDIPTS